MAPRTITDEQERRWTAVAFPDETASPVVAQPTFALAAWVVDTTNLARSYGMEVRAVRACG